MGNVKYTIVGNADDAAKAVDKLRSQFDKLEQKLRDQAKYSRQSKAATSDWASSQISDVRNMVLGIFSIQTAWNAASAALTAYGEAGKKVQDNRTKVAASVRETEIKLINQGQLNPDEVAKTMQNVEAATQAIPVGTVHDSKRITEEMFSQGFDRQEVINGETLKAFLKLKAATNQFGEGAIDSKELVKSIATSLRNTEGRAAGQEITAQEIENFGRAFHSLFFTSIQLQDAIPFARIQSILTARGIDNQTQLAAFATAVDAFGSGEVAATYLQQATAYMGRAGSEKMRDKLDKLGIEIDGTKFDLVGEDLVEALRNLDQMVGSLDPRTKADALDALFGTKAQAGALTLMSKSGVIEDYRSKIAQADGSSYDKAETNFRLSDQARATETANRADIADAQGLKAQASLTFEDVQKYIDTTHQKLAIEGAGGGVFTLDVMAADLRRKIGFNNQTPQEYLDFLQTNSSGRGKELLQREVDKADPRSKQMEVIRDALREENPTGEEPPRPEIVFPAQMEVSDPQLQTSVDQLNTTMTRVADYLERGPDQQRVVRVPRGTA